MIRWGEEKRRKDPGFFARCAEEACDPAKVWIVGDCRRPTDFQYFQVRVVLSATGKFPAVKV